MRYVLLMSTGERRADGVTRRALHGWPDEVKGPRVKLIDPGRPMYEPDMATTVTVDPWHVRLSDGPVVAPERALDAYCVVEGLRSAVIDYVATLPAVHDGAVVEIRAVTQNPVISPA